MVKRLIKFIFILTVIFIWIFSGWPKIYNIPQTPSLVNAAEVTVASTVNLNTNIHKLNPILVFVSDQIGYAFFRTHNKAAAPSCGFTKTINGGSSWGSFTAITAQNDCTGIAVWYDQWTPGDTTGTVIHIVFSDLGNDDVWYDTLDTNGDSQGTEVSIDGTAVTLDENDNLSITKATDGVLYIALGDASGSGISKVRECSTTCATGGNWSTSGTSPLDQSNDYLSLAPLASGNIMIIKDDISASTILSKAFNTTTNTWDGSWTTIDGSVTSNTTYVETLVSTVDKKTNDIYIAYVHEPSLALGSTDIRTAIYSGGSWTTKGEVVSNASDAITNTHIAFNENNGDVYVAYLRGASTSSLNSYYKLSTNSMTSWGSETLFSTSSGGLLWMYTNMMSIERIFGAYIISGTTSTLLGNTIADLTPPTYKMSAYRFFANANSADVGSALASQDTAATAPTQGTPFRLRLLLDVSGDGARASLDTFKLQYAEKSGTCDTSYSGESYADVATGSGAIRFHDNATPTDGATLTGNANDPTHGGHTIVNQTYEEQNNFTNSVAKISGNQDGKWDFALVDFSATGGTSYCFRVVESDGSAIATPDFVPEITTEEIAQSLTFSISDNSVGFGTLSSSSARYATGDGLGASSESGDTHTISASTNGTGGYVISVNGSTLTCAGCGGATITAIGSSATVSSVGSEQFGLRIIVNSGTGSALSPYNTLDWALDTAAFPDSISSGNSDGVTSEFGIRYIGNITNTTEAGNYAATLTYTATATF